MMNKFNHTLIALLATSFTLGMSSPRSPSELKADPTAEAGAEPVVEKHRHFKGYVKPHAGINIHSDLPGVMQVGEQHTARLKFHLDSQVDTLLVDLRLATSSSEQGLQLGKQHFEINNVRDVQLEVPVTALTDGLYTIEVNTRMVQPAQTQARSFVLTVRVGEAGDKSAAESRKSGYTARPEQGVISMPAVETD